MTFAGEFLGLPGLRGYWPMNAFDSTGAALDLSGNGRTLTYNGNPTFNFTTQGGPYLDLDGTGDFESRADESALDIIGTESYVASAVRGLTMGGWFWFDSVGSSRLLQKGTTAGNLRAYSLYLNATVITMQVSSNGTATTEVTGGVASASAWYFIVGRYTPSAELAIFVNSTETDNTTSIPASIFNSSAGLAIYGQADGSSLTDGRASNCFLCAAILGDTMISNLFEATRDFYGV